MVMAGAILIFDIEGAVNIADSAFTASQAQLSGGTMIYFLIMIIIIIIIMIMIMIYTFIHMCIHFEKCKANR